MGATPAAADEAALSVEGLTKRYGDVIAIENLSFSVRRGAVTGFLGPNGAGKTTALKVIVGVARATAGHVRVAGMPADAPVTDARVMGVHIEPTGAHPGRTARAHLRSLAAMAGVGRGRVDEVLALVGLQGAADARVGRYSLGMRQRLGLAAALLGDPQILLLDEPLNGLDPQGIRWLRTLLRGYAARGRTVLLSSHVLTEVAQSVDDVVVLHRGRLVRHASMEELGRGGGERVLVATPTRERLATAVARAGGRAELRNRDGLLIDGLDAAAVSGLAHSEGVLLHQLATQGDSLEDLYFSLTGEETI